MHKFLLTTGATIALAASAHAQLFWKTDGTAGAWTGATWGTSAAGPFTTAWTDNSNTDFSANSTLTFATASIGDVKVEDGVTVSVAAGGTLSMNGAVRTFDIGTGSTLTWQGQTVTASSTAGITKNGAGTLDLGALTFTTSMTGGFTLNNGTVIATGNKALGNGALTINGGTLQSTGTRAFAPTSLTIGGDFAFAGTGNANWDAATTVSLGAVTRTITNNTASGSRQIRGLISGATGAGLNFAGAGGAQIYIGNTGNTFTGPVAITAGEVVFNGDGAFGGTNSITLDGGRLTMASMATDGTASALTAATIASSRNIFVGATAGTSISVQGATGVTTYSGVIADKIGSTGSWAKQGAGRLELGGISTYTGSTSINNGTLRLIGGNDRLPTGTTVNIGQAASANVGTVDLNGFNQQIAGLNSTTGTNATVSKNTVTSVTAATLTFGGSGTYAYGDGTAANSGIISGAIAVSKTGSGTQTLGDANTYTGGTTITGGTLIAAHASALGAGSVLVNGGALASTVATASLGGDLTVSSGSLSANQSAVGQFSLASNKSFSMSGGTLDLTILSGASFDSIVSLGGTSSFSITGGTLDLSGSTLAAGDYAIFSGFTSGSGDFSSIVGHAGFSVTFDATTPGMGVLHIVAVPEPGTYALFVSAMLVCIVVVRRRRARA